MVIEANADGGGAGGSVGGGTGGSSGSVGGAGSNGGGANSGGSGGNGGASGLTSPGSLVVNTNTAGGNGSDGGMGAEGHPFAGGGGGGGAGGYGLLVTGAGTIVNNATIVGGRGGRGGDGGNLLSFLGGCGVCGAGNGGDGGDGGTGIKFNASGSVLTNNGTIQGGLGGHRGNPGGPICCVFPFPGNEGNVGTGVIGYGLTLVNSGLISGSNAVVFSGGSNTLTTSGGGSLFGNIAIASGSLTLLQLSQSAAYANTITGAGAVTVTTGPTYSVTLSGANTYSGGTTVSAGSTLIVGNSQALGTGAVAFQSSASLVANVDGLNIANQLTGAGAVTVTTSAAGAVTLSGANSFGGGTTVSAGSTLILGNSQALGTGIATLQGGAALVFGSGLTIGNSVVLNGSDTFSVGGVATYTGAITSGGPASLTKAGNGTLIITGLGNTVAGSVIVNAGTLEVDGSLQATAPVAVNAAATLAGFGQINGSVQINSGGFWAPSSAMRIAGDLTLQAGSIFAPVIGAVWAAPSVTGNATLTGSTFAPVLAAGGYLRNQTLVLRATTVSGTFSTLNMPLGYHGVLNYAGGNVYLDLTANLFGSNALARNHALVASVHDSYFNSGGAIPTRLAMVAGLSGSSLNFALNQISGETPTGAQQSSFGAMTGFMGIMTDMSIDGRGGSAPDVSANVSAYAATGRRTDAERDAYAAMTRTMPEFSQRWSVWAAGFGGSQKTDGDTAVGSNNTSSRVYGTAVGADYAPSPDLRLGFALAGGGTTFGVVNGGTGRSDLFQAGAYLKRSAGPTYFIATVAYGWQDLTTDRTITVAGTDQLRAQFDANAWSGRVEGGYRWVAPWAGGIGITPYAGLQAIIFDLPAYTERTVVGDNSFALNYDAKRATDVRSELGLRTDQSFALMDATTFTLRGRVAWARDFTPDRSVNATFQSMPGISSFVVNGASRAGNAALTTLSAEAKWPRGFSVASSLDGEFSNVTRAYNGKLVARYQW